jgi:molybdenum cofactor biosynthesis enzyme MoaA
MISLHVLKVDISGGEPLLYNFLKEICCALNNNKIFITLTTRGIGLEENIKWLINNAYIFSRVIISIDVPNGELFEKISGKAEFFHNTNNLVDNLKYKNYSNIRVNTVVTKYLLSNENLKEMVNLVNKTECKEWCLIEPHKANKKSYFDEVVVNNCQFNEIIHKIKNEFQLNCKVIIRYSTNYAGYWVLYADGILAKHSKSEYDEIKIDFLNTSSNYIMKKVIEKHIWLPKEDL